MRIPSKLLCDGRSTSPMFIGYRVRRLLFGSIVVQALSPRPPAESPIGGPFEPRKKMDRTSLMADAARTLHVMTCAFILAAESAARRCQGTGEQDSPVPEQSLRRPWSRKNIHPD